MQRDSNDELPRTDLLETQMGVLQNARQGMIEAIAVIVARNAMRFDERVRVDDVDSGLQSNRLKEIAQIRVFRINADRLRGYVDAEEHLRSDEY
ncbi:MAG: hypothetical protein KJO98_06550 [Rhodothermia bacterium]|nr:hypothetical protein [Rhodothermia bacterium]